MNKIYFVVEMLRSNDCEQHSYVIGVFDDELPALKEAWDHMRFRGGKYGACVKGFELNGGLAVYRRDLDSWEVFAESCKDLAAALKPLLEDKEEL